MREILFKAKRKDNRKWVYGNYVHTDCFTKCNDYMGQNKPMEYMIDPGTLCQYTGLADCNGKKICENDIVSIPGEDDLFIIKWDKDQAKFTIESETLSCDFDNYSGNELEIVGNVFDNSDLLEGENGNT